MDDVDRQHTLRGVLTLLCVGLVLVALGIVVSRGWWSVGLVGAGLGLSVEAAILARRGYPRGQRPPPA